MLCFAGGGFPVPLYKPVGRDDPARRLHEISSHAIATMAWRSVPRHHEKEKER